MNIKGIIDRLLGRKRCPICGDAYTGNMHFTNMNDHVYFEFGADGSKCTYSSLAFEHYVLLLKEDGSVYEMEYLSVQGSKRWKFEPHTIWFDLSDRQIIINKIDMLRVLS